MASCLLRRCRWFYPSCRRFTHPRLGAARLGRVALFLLTLGGEWLCAGLCHSKASNGLLCLLGQKSLESPTGGKGRAGVSSRGGPSSFMPLKHFVRWRTSLRIGSRYLPIIETRAAAQMRGDENVGRNVGLLSQLTLCVPSRRSSIPAVLLFRASPCVGRLPAAGGIRGRRCAWLLHSPASRQGSWLAVDHPASPVACIGSVGSGERLECGGLGRCGRAPNISPSRDTKNNRWAWDKFATCDKPLWGFVASVATHVQSCLCDIFSLVATCRNCPQSIKSMGYTYVATCRNLSKTRKHKLI